MTFKNSLAINYSQLLIAIVFSIFVSSCGSNNQESKDVEQKKEYDSFSEHLANTNTSSYEFVSQVKNSGLPFQKQLVNDPYEYRSYKKDLNISAANIGIYITDAQYLRAYGKVEEAYLSGTAAQRLFKLVETKKLDTSLLQLQEGFRREDSALFFLNDALKDTANGLSSKERKQYILSMAYGNFIERNYILLTLLNKQGDYKKAEVKTLFKYLKKHNDQLSILLELRQGNSSGEYHTYLSEDLLLYHDYYLQNLDAFNKDANAIKQAKLVADLLEKNNQMRNYLIYSGLLLK